jgi:hypothetical protein
MTTFSTTPIRGEYHPDYEELLRLRLREYQTRTGCSYEELRELEKEVRSVPFAPYA